MFDSPFIFTTVCSDDVQTEDEDNEVIPTATDTATKSNAKTDPDQEIAEAQEEAKNLARDFRGLMRANWKNREITHNNSDSNSDVDEEDEKVKEVDSEPVVAVADTNENDGSSTKKPTVNSGNDTAEVGDSLDYLDEIDDNDDDDDDADADEEEEEENDSDDDVVEPTPPPRQKKLSKATATAGQTNGSDENAVVDDADKGGSNFTSEIETATATTATACRSSDKPTGKRQLNELFNAHFRQILDAVEDAFTIIDEQVTNPEEVW